MPIHYERLDFKPPTDILPDMQVLGVDIGGTEIKAGLVSRDGVLLKNTRLATPDSIAGFAEAMRIVWQQLGASDIDGIGIGCKGIIHPVTTRVEVLPGTLRYLEGHVLRGFFPAASSVAADNDARAALAGELAWGAAKGRQDAIMLTLGTGVGGGVLSGGRIVRGAGGVAGHLGHYTLDPMGPLCICGNHGCLETYFSARAIESEAEALIHRGAVDWPAAPTCEQVFRRAGEGDEAARWIVDRAIRQLGAALAGLVHALDPEVVILGGQIASAGESLTLPLEKDIERRTRVLLRRGVPVVRSALSAGSGALGAAALAFEAR